MQRSSRLTAAALAAVLIAPVVPIAATAAAAAEPAAATAAAPPNLALTATATASSTELDDARFVPAHVNDGDASTRWSSKYQDDNWVQLALAEPADVERVVIDWPNACARAFSIQTSVDGVTWTTQAERTSATCPRTDDIEIDAGGPVGFVRMQGAQRWSTWGYSIAEFAVYDQPLPEPEPQLPLVPQPVSVERGEGDYVLPRDAEVRATGEAAEAGEYLADVIPSRPDTTCRSSTRATRRSRSRSRRGRRPPGTRPRGTRST
ncbi:discoidin domain-containing protein [Agromyces endophyticus]|uniref:discoidin domain-containing protein n=1 Tax=Agromyces sp. H17E-10 TaxID=2932244 RepID=UPI001FD37103|nr:discoidin domain-containing protein [Agromyces sp. H17E-10]UOQ90281.1 discoidin domain-containing protein [Agromyces sp. H17E-10]